MASRKEDEHHINKFERYILNKQVKRIMDANSKHNLSDYWIDFDSVSSEVNDSIDSTWTYSENLTNAKDVLSENGLNPNILEELKDDKDRIEKFEKMEKELFLFKKEIFNINGRIINLRKKQQHYFKGFKKLKELHSNIIVTNLPLESYGVGYEDEIGSCLNKFKKEDSFSNYRKSFRSEKDNKCNFGKLNPKDLTIRKMTAKEVLGNAKPGVQYSKIIVPEKMQVLFKLNPFHKSKKSSKPNIQNDIW